MRDEHKREFTEASKKNAQNRKIKLVEITSEIEQLDNFIIENKKFVETNVLPNLKLLHVNIEKQTNEFNDLNNELNEINYAEHEISSQMKKIDAEKRKELNTTLVKIYVENDDFGVEQKLQEIKENIVLKNKHIKSLEQQFNLIDNETSEQ